jgi:hypothetical protein
MKKLGRFRPQATHKQYRRLLHMLASSMRGKVSWSVAA